MIEGCYVLRAIEMVEEGYEPQQIIDDLTNMREHTGAYLIVAPVIRPLFCKFFKSSTIKYAPVCSRILVKSSIICCGSYH
jgi:hypothetical protein